MPRQTGRPSARNQGSDALQSLLNDQAEARLQKEISISRVEHGQNSKDPAGKPDSAAEFKTESNSTSQASHHPHLPASGLRKPPSMRETKAQLIERMEKLISEMDRLEAEIEQKDLEKQRAEKDKDRLSSDIDQLKNEKTFLELELGKKEESLTNTLDEQQELEKKLSDLEKENRDLFHQVDKKERVISDLAKENQDLKARVQDMDVGSKKLASMESDLRSSLNEKDRENYLLRQEIEKLQKDGQKMRKQVTERDNESQSRQKKMGAADWREKANALWDGTGYTAPQKAISYLNAALEIKPDWPEALNDRGLAHLDDYQLDKSLDDFTDAISFKGDFAEAYHNRGVALLKSGKKFAARKDFQIAARHGLWLGMNSLSAPSASHGFLQSIKKLIGIGRRD